MQEIKSSTDLQCPIQPRLQRHRDILLAHQGRVQEAHPGEAHQGHQGGQLEHDRAEHSEGRPGKGEEMRHRWSEPHLNSSLVAEH